VGVTLPEVTVASGDKITTRNPALSGSAVKLYMESENDS
jgi:hypothetical protein